MISGEENENKRKILRMDMVYDLLLIVTINSSSGESPPLGSRIWVGNLTFGAGIAGVPSHRADNRGVHIPLLEWWESLGTRYIRHAMARSTVGRILFFPGQKRIISLPGRRKLSLSRSRYGSDRPFRHSGIPRKGWVNLLFLRRCKLRCGNSLTADTPRFLVNGSFELGFFLFSNLF